MRLLQYKYNGLGRGEKKLAFPTMRWMDMTQRPRARITSKLPKYGSGRRPHGASLVSTQIVVSRGPSHRPLSPACFLDRKKKGPQTCTSMIHPGCPGTLLAAVRPVLQLKMAQLTMISTTYAPAATARPRGHRGHDEASRLPSQQAAVATASFTPKQKQGTAYLTLHMRPSSTTFRVPSPSLAHVRWLCAPRRPVPFGAAG